MSPRRAPNRRCQRLPNTERWFSEVVTDLQQDYSSVAKRIPLASTRSIAGIVLALGLALFASVSAAAEYALIVGGKLTSVLPTVNAQAGDSAVASPPVEVAAYELRSEPVTNADFLAFVQAHPQWRRDRVVRLFAEPRYLSQWPAAEAIGGDARPDQPVTQVSWFAAQAYCESEGGRLPSWHEWEFAAAADATRTDARNDPAWREKILNWYALPSSAPLAAIGGAPNVYGVRDLHGLIWEWVEDAGALLVSSDSRDQDDSDRLKFCGAGALELKDRENYAVLMRIALLSSLKAVDTTANLGFRCAKPTTRK